MQLIIQKENINSGINTVIGAIAVRGIQPVLSNVLIEATEDNKLSFKATDLDITIGIEVPATVSQPGSITLPAKKLREIISKLPDQPINISLNSDNNMTTITCGNSKFDLIGISSSEFPQISVIDSKDSVEVEVEPLLKAIRETVFATATYDTNNILSGVFFNIKNETLEMAATDGNRLARVIKKTNNKTDKEYSIVIPSRTLNEISRISGGSTDEKVIIDISNGQISFKFKDRYLISRLLEGQYPKYQQLIPENYSMVAVSDRDTLISALERAATMVNERTSIIKFTLTENKMQLMADTPELGDSSDEIDIDFNDEELKIAFNYKYILDTLKVMDSDKVKIEFGGPLAAALLKPDTEEDYLCLIMPVQVR